MVNILFIAFEFPPLNNGGVFRPLAFVNYLPEAGIRPIVITLARESYPDVFTTYSCDETLGKEIIGNSTLVSVPAVKGQDSSRWRQFASIYFSIHGQEVKNWKQPFYEAVEKAIALYSPKAIFATVPPFSILPLAEKISEKYRLPLILDFRDAWSQWRTSPYGTILHYWRTLQLERKYLRKASAVIATSRQTLDDFKKFHLRIPTTQFHYIPNGYNGSLKTWQTIAAGKQEFVIGYVGSFYYSPEARSQMLQPWWQKKGHRMLQYIPQKQDWLYRSPYFFFMALQQLKETNPVLAQKIKVKFAGKKAPWLADMIVSFGLEGQVSHIGEISHKESLSFQQQCDALLITSAKQLGGRDYSIAGKTFEYLQMQKPVIAFVCDGAQKDLLRDSGTALLCDPDNTNECTAKLSDLFEGRIHLQPDLAFLQKLSRQELTRELAELIKTQFQKA